MDVKLLIDDIVRQTTVLIAQLSTAAGVRAPLSHIADQVFVELARDLEAQGVRRKVVADMFGLALRSYQLKFQRLTESAERGTSLWQLVHERLSGSAQTRGELSAALAPAEAADVAAVLHDLVGSGLAYSSGRGPSAVFGLTSDADRKRFSTASKTQALAHMVWQMVATGRASTREELLGQLSVESTALDVALAELMRDGRVTHSEARYAAESLHIPVGSEQGWEAAVSDHFRAVATAIASKLRDGRSRRQDTIGGATLSFTVYSGHPLEAEVYGLLERTRARVGDLWERVSDHNKTVKPPESAPKISFYFGQNVTLNEPEPSSEEGHQ
jgi:hypothetical protein